MSKQTVLFISPSEFCHNPRILKASDAFYNEGYGVVVWEIIQGSAEPSLNQKVKGNRPYIFHSFDISKRNAKSYIEWLLASLTQKLALMLWRFFHSESFLFKYTRLKGLLGFKCHDKYDFIYINVVDALPFAIYLSRKTGTKVIFDSQEYFKGQYENDDYHTRQWVEFAERENLYKSYIVIGTTNALINQLKKEYPAHQRWVRVRNLPFNPVEISTEIKSKNLHRLELVWHGYAIHYGSRGVNIILEAVCQCDFDIHISLMGKISTNERKIISDFMQSKGHLNRLKFIPPAHPEHIVEALINYDIGIIGELPLNENQKLTSSNKLFEYLHAGLAVVTSDMPGILETINDEKCGLVYSAGNVEDLYNKLLKLHTDRSLFNFFRENSRNFAMDNNWQKDFNLVIAQI